MYIEPVIIENGEVTIRPAAGGVWLTKHQIADLFGVFVSGVSSNIRSILKSGVLREEKVRHHQKNGNGTFVEVYNLEMITALAFRLHSENAQIFRKWIVEAITTPLVVWRIPGNGDDLPS